MFDDAWYLWRYPDVRHSGVDPLGHYRSIGAREGREPNALFSPTWYAARYPDIAETGVDPLDHYLEFGEDLVRRPVETLSAVFGYADLDDAGVTVEAVIETATQAASAWAGRHRTTETADDSIGRWRRDLEPRTQAICAETFGEFLGDFGYDRAAG